MILAVFYMGIAGAIGLSNFLLRNSEFSVSSGSINKFLSVFELCRASVSLLPIPVFLDSETLYQFSSKLLAIHDLVWQSFECLSVSHRTTYILLEACLSLE